MPAVMSNPRARAMDKRGRGGRPMSEINVTPFVDVMLVLLIVFMVTAPLLTVGVPVDLPQTRAKSLGEDREPLAVTIDNGGRIFLQNTPIGDGRSGAEADGDLEQWLQPAHFRPRRQSRGLRQGDGGDGAFERGRLHPHRSGHRCREKSRRRRADAREAATPCGA